MPVPDITGQPAWVVIVVAALALAATLGVAYLTYLASKHRKSTTGTDPEQDTLPSGVAEPTVLIMQAAMDHLARVADREAAESEEARREADALRARLEDQLREFLILQRENAEIRDALARCQAKAELLSEQAFRRGRDD